MPRRPHRRRSRRPTILLAVVVTLALTAFGLARVSHVPVAERLVDAGQDVVRRAPSTVAEAASKLAPDADDGSNSSDGDDSGYIPTGESISVFADHPAVTRLDPALRTAIRRATVDARGDGITIRLNSGWRSAAYQQRLLDEATARYGSEQRAREYVNTPERSTHVQGRGVDLGPTDADSWLSQHGADYGLCQTYANEIWHFELATEPGGTCPAQRVNASAG